MTRETLRFKVCFTQLFLLAIQPGLLAQSNLLKSGPMVGYSTMKEVLIWVQTVEPASVQARYWPESNPAQRTATEVIRTQKENANVAKLIADRLEPGQKYGYELLINDRRASRPYALKFQTQALWQWRNDPPAFKMAVGSCVYVNDPPYDRPGEPYGANYEIFTHIYNKNPDFMLWLGDNTYLREADWNSRSGIIHRYSHTRALKELQPLLGSAHHYAIWDDHDYGPNDSDRSWWNKETTLEVFRLFWGNPSYGIDDLKGVITKFQWADIDFFLLDNRYHRSPNNRKTGERVILGDKQIQWLIDALSDSFAPFKIVVMGGQFLNPDARFENFATAPSERAKILRLIEQENIPGVLFVTGDVHRTEMTKFERRNTYPLYDITISPLTAGPTTTIDEKPNYLRIENTLVLQRNFAIFDFSRPRLERTMKIAVYDTNGNELWSYYIRAQELR